MGECVRVTENLIFLTVTEHMQGFVTCFKNMYSLSDTECSARSVQG